MELILKKQDLINLRGKMPTELVDYLEQEFMDLYEYYNLNQELDDFILEQSQSMGILANDEEIKTILEEPLEIEFVERFVKEQLTFYRLGVRNAGEIQLFYYVENRHGKAILEILKEMCS